MTTANVAVTEGSGKNVATYSISEDAATKQLQRVVLNDSAGAELVGSTIPLDNAGFTDGTTPVLPAGFIFDEVAGTALTENDAAAARIDSKRAQTIVLEDATTRGRKATVSSGGALSTQDSGASWTTVFGVTGAVVTSADATTPVAVTDAPTAGQKLVITDIIASSEVEQWLEFEIETAATIFLKAYLPANGTVQITPRSKLKLPTADKKLMVDAETAGNIAVTVFYYSEA